MAVDTIAKRISAFNFLSMHDDVMPVADASTFSLADRGNLLGIYAGVVTAAAAAVVSFLFRPFFKWIEGAVHIPHDDLFSDRRDVARQFGERIKLTLAPGSADTVTTIPHNLGRVPQALRIVNVTLSAAADVVWYRLDSDRDWNIRDIDVRFRFDDGDVLLEVT